MPFRNNAVLLPYVNFYGDGDDAVILRQLSSNRFLVAKYNDKTVQIEMTLTNNDLSKSGNGRLNWYTYNNINNGYVAHIYDNTIHTFDKKILPWNLAGTNAMAINHALAYISNNSRD